MARPSLRPAVDEALNGELDSLLTIHRTHLDPPTSWDDLAQQIRDKTGIKVSRQTLRNWYAEAAA